jgi:hypothetical protein
MTYPPAASFQCRGTCGRYRTHHYRRLLYCCRLESEKEQHSMSLIHRIGFRAASPTTYDLDLLLDVEGLRFRLQLAQLRPDGLQPLPLLLPTSSQGHKGGCGDRNRWKESWAVEADLPSTTCFDRPVGTGLRMSGKLLSLPYFRYSFLTQSPPRGKTGVGVIRNSISRFPLLILFTASTAPFGSCAA